LARLFGRLSKSREFERHRIGGACRLDTTVKERAMQYMLMIYSSEAAMQAATAEQIEQLIGAYGAYTEAVKAAGVLVAADRLRPSACATTVRTADGKTQVLNGPYAETKEQLGGYYLIEVADLDAALAWASRCPAAAYGAVEVRPIWAM
jgi:hypothetical protein